MSVWFDKRLRKYRAQVYDPSTKRMREVKGGPWADRRDALRAELAAVDARGPRGSLSVESFAAGWPESHPSPRRTKESTTIRHREKIKRFVSEHGSRRMDAVTTTVARDFCKLHPSDLPSLRAMFEDARRDGLVQGNPFSRLGIDRSKGRKNVKSDWLSAEDVDRLVQCARDVHRFRNYGDTMAAILTFAAYTGVRPGELMGLEWHDLRPDSVTIRQALDGKTGRLTLPKNNREREIVYPKIARDAVALMPRMAGQRFVFVAPSGKPLRHGSLRYVWYPVRAAFGRPTMEMYELRHFCATYLWERLPEADVAVQLGHTDGGALVREVYGHRSDIAARARILAAFDGYEGGDISTLRARRQA